MTVKPTEVSNDIVTVRIALAKASAESNTDNHNTVRANQGGTTPVSILYCTHQDEGAIALESPQIVGLSRHTSKLYLATDESEVGTY